MIPLPLRFTLAIGVFVALAGLPNGTFGDEAKDAGSGLVVHEWGVLWAGTDNGNPIVGTTDKYLNSLPKFVLRNELFSPNVFVAQPEIQIVTKPVIHFYGAERQSVEVTVKVAKGFPIVYYPEPELTKTTLPTVNQGGKFGTLEHAQSMTWKFHLTKRTPGGLAIAPPDHWWNSARDIPSNYVVMENGKGSERFLFYEGTTAENPTITASVAADSITFRNADSSPSAPVILIINDHGSRSGVYLDSIKADGQLEIARPKIRPWGEEALLANCRKQWEACGMTTEEAAGIVNSWRPELLNTPGFLLISALPDRIYEGIFPIEIKPAPAELERACLVFDTLAGQDARKSWLPELRKEGEALIRELDAPDFKKRLEAHSKIVGIGECLSPFINEVLENADADPQSKMAATILQKILAESMVCPHRPPKEVPGWGGRGFIRREPLVLPGELIIPELPVIPELPATPK